MSLQYVSDIHLEFYDKQNTGSIDPSQFITPTAPYLALVGDIGIPELAAYSVFLRWCSQKWKQIFVVAGNHEYYRYRCEEKNDMETKRKSIQTICSGLSNVTFLDCSSALIPELNVRLLGCTLWSSIPDCLTGKVVTYMNDTRQILKEKDVPFLPNNMTELHEKERQWLNQEIHKCELTNERCIVLTHYLPSYSLIAEKYKGHFLNACFASDCEDLMRPPVIAWICGHSHMGVQTEIHGVQCHMNPFGYPGEDVPSRSKAACLSLADGRKN